LDPGNVGNLYGFYSVEFSGAGETLTIDFLRDASSSAVLHNMKLVAATLVLDFAPPDPLGDFNTDQVVDLVDYGILRDHLKAHLDGPVSYFDGDIDIDSDIDLDDFRQFKDLFPGVVTAATSIPEPSSLVLALGALAGITALVRHPGYRARRVEN
jgi:hypothetical protein